MTAKVKPLEFEKLFETTYRAFVWGKLSYRLERIGSGRWRVNYSFPGYCAALIEELFETVDEARAAAQADYERRILSAIETTPPSVAEAAEIKISVEVSRVKVWGFCPECGSDECNDWTETHKICLNCNQDWHTDVDYTKTVGENLKQLVALAKGEAQ